MSVPASPLLFAPLGPVPLRASRLSSECPWSSGATREGRKPTCASASRALAGAKEGHPAQEGQDAPPSKWSCAFGPEARTFIALDGSLSPAET